LLDIIIDNENIIIDVGGNKTTTFVIDSLSNTGIINALDLIVIPLGDGEQDASNAIKLYNRVRELNNEIKIVFALSV
jgi:flavorubredoxin